MALPLGLVLLTLVACAAVRPGEQPGVPIEQPTRLSETMVLPGQTVYVSYAYPRSVFEDDGELAPRFDAISLDYARVRGAEDRVPDAYVDAPWFTLQSVEAPIGVSMSLLRARIGRVITQTQLSGGSVNVRYREEFRLLYRISVAADFRWPSASIRLPGFPLAPRPPSPLSVSTSPPTLPQDAAGQSVPENAYATLTFSDGRRSTGTRLYLKFSR